MSLIFVLAVFIAVYMIFPGELPAWVVRVFGAIWFVDLYRRVMKGYMALFENSPTKQLLWEVYAKILRNIRRKSSKEPSPELPKEFHDQYRKICLSHSSRQYFHNWLLAENAPSEVIDRFGLKKDDGRSPGEKVAWEEIKKALETIYGKHFK